MKNRTKKLLALLITASMAMTLLVGCGGDSSSDTSDSSSTESTESTGDSTSEEVTDYAGTEIVLMASQNWIKDVDYALFEKFEEETGISVEVSVAPDSDYTTLLGTTLAGGSDAIDMFMYGAGSEMVSAGITEISVDLSNESWVDNQEYWAQSANTYEGVQYGFSTWSIDYEGVIYNKTFFEENGLEVPTTWDEFITLCDDIVDLGVTPFYEGINGTWHTQMWAYSLTPSMALENPDYINYLNESADNKFADFDCFVEGLTQIQQFLTTSEYYTNDGQAEDWFGSYTSLQERETVMMCTYSAYVTELEANGCTDEWGMFATPMLDNTTVVSNGGGISKFISTNSNNIEACKLLLEFLAEDENLETYYAERTDLPIAAFVDVESAVPSSALTEILAGDVELIPVRFSNDVYYWDPDVYQYCQGMAAGTLTPEEFVANVDAYRAVMFDTVAE